MFTPDQLAAAQAAAAAPSLAQVSPSQPVTIKHVSFPYLVHLTLPGPGQSWPAKLNFLCVADATATHTALHRSLIARLPS